MSQVATYINLNMNEISNRIAANLKDLGLLKGNLGDIAHISEALWKEIWFKFIEKTDPIVEEFAKVNQELFERQRAEVLRNMRKNPYKKELTPEQSRFVDSWLFDRDKWVEEFADESAPNITGGVLTGGLDAMDKLDIPTAFDPTTVAIQDFVANKSFKFAKEVNGTTAALLRNNLSSALENGESVQQMMKRVDNVFDYSVGSRSRTIAQTEMIGAVNYGATEGNKQSGVVWGMQWIGALDDRIREDHETLTIDEVAVPLGEDFPIVDVEYPGDPSGDPEQIINCRCTTKPLTRGPNGEVPAGQTVTPGQTPRPTQVPGAEVTPSWSPTMTAADAARWNASSSVKRTIYHGSNAADKIKKEGFKLTGTAKTGRYYGDGVYLAQGKKVAASYNPNVLSIKINVDKVFDMSKIQASTEAHANFVKAQIKWFNDTKTPWPSDGAEAIKMFLQGTGNDALKYTAGEGYGGSDLVYVVFDPKNVTVIQ